VNTPPGSIEFVDRHVIQRGIGDLIVEKQVICIYARLLPETKMCQEIFYRSAIIQAWLQETRWLDARQRRVEALSPSLHIPEQRLAVHRYSSQLVLRFSR